MCPINSLSSPHASSSLSKLNKTHLEYKKALRKNPGAVFHARFPLPRFLLTLCSVGLRQKMKENR